MPLSRPTLVGLTTLLIGVVLVLTLTSFWQVFYV